MSSRQLMWVTRSATVVAIVASVACGTDELAPSDAAVATVQVDPPSASVVVGANVTLTASPLDAAGAVLTGRKVLWASADPNFATVSTDGVVTGRYAGTVPIAASVDGKAGIAQVKVLPLPVVAVRLTPASRDLTVGEVAQLTAEPVDARGLAVVGRPVMWSSSRPNVATVSGSGVVAAVSVGTAVITATVDGKSGVAAVTVASAPVTSVAVSPSSATLVVGQTLELEAQPRDAGGHALIGRAVTWSSNQPNIVTVASSGIVAAVSPGTATVTASSEGRSGTATITVNAPTVNRVEVTPATAVISVGSSFRLSATVFDSRGNVIPGAKVAWSSSDTRIAIVDNNGRVTAVRPGSVVVTATSGDKAGTASVSVRN
jgi:uncharacterized protein YjdB